LKKGMTLLMAIVFILTIGVILALALSFSSQSVSKTIDNFHYNQAKLMTRSAAEYTLLALAGHDIAATGTCIDAIDLTYNKIYEINVSILYIGQNFPASCPMLSNALNEGSKESNGTVILDIVTTVKDEPIRITKRIITKI